MPNVWSLTMWKRNGFHNAYAYLTKKTEDCGPDYYDGVSMCLAD